MELSEKPPTPAASRAAAPGPGVRPVPLLVKGFRLAGALACFGITVNMLICMVRSKFTDAVALGPFAALIALLGASVWICRQELIESYRARRLHLVFYGAVQAGLACVALCLLLYLFAWKFHARVDVTVNRINELSEETLQTLARLSDSPEPVESVYLQASDPQDAEHRQWVMDTRLKIQELLRSYQTRTEVSGGRFTFTTVHSMEEPSRVAELSRRTGIPSFAREAGEGECVVFLCGDRAKLIPLNEMFEFVSYDSSSRRHVFQGERVFTAVVREFLEPRRKALYFLSNHGERSAEELESLRDLLKKQNFEPRDLDLSAAEIPEDATAVASCGPRSAFSPEELVRLRAFLQRGGHALFFLDPVLPSVTGMARENSGLAPLLAEYGLGLRQDLLTRGYRPTFLGEPALLPQVYALPNPASSSVLLRALLMERTPAVFAQPCAVQTGPPAPDKMGYTPEVLLQTPAYKTADLMHWADPVSLAQPRKEAGPESLRGPVPLAAFSRVAKPKDEKKEDDMARILVVAGSYMATQKNYITHPGNPLFLLPCVRWIMGDDELVGTIPSREAEARVAKFEEGQGRVLMVLLIFGLPLALVFAGVVVWSARRT